MNEVKTKKIIYFPIGKPVTARESIFTLTENKKYVVLNYEGDRVKIQNDLGEEDWYTIEYFQEFVGLYR